MELEAENAKLSADPTAPFAQGDDAGKAFISRTA
jgi:hypothetical protein